LGTTLKSQNYINEEIKSRQTRNARYHLVQDRLSSSLLAKNTEIKIHITVILPVVLYGCESWSVLLRKEHKLRVSENRVPMNI